MCPGGPPLDQLPNLAPSPGTQPRVVGRRLAGWGLLALLLCACGARRSVLIESTPPGALVRLDDEVVGTTPLDHPFVHYGTRRVTLYLPGYRTWSQAVAMEPHWYARFPLDLITEVLLPLNLRDRRHVQVELTPDDGEQDIGDLEAFVERAEAIRAAGVAAPIADDSGAPEAGSED
ncbi:MAG: hypothetical protein ACI8QC_002706 [Planctomycetota bacterium]|jgi:hypothetical protein